MSTAGSPPARGGRPSRTRGAGRRHDPHRRERICDAALELVAEVGVAGTTHRRVAERADVPLGSTTYHFASLDDLLTAAFERFAERQAAAYAAHVADAVDVPALVDALTSLIHGVLATGDRDQAVALELYAYATRHVAARSLTRSWMAASRDALERLLAPGTARIVDAFVEGAALHVALDPEPQTPEQTREALARLMGLAQGTS